MTPSLSRTGTGTQARRLYGRYLSPRSEHVQQDQDRALHDVERSVRDLEEMITDGRITVNHPLTVQGSLSRKEIRGKVGNGGPLLEVRTGSGNIVVQ